MIRYSIIIPTHNRPEHLMKNITSWANLNECEIVIIENNSTEKNLKKYREIALPKNAKISFNKFNSKFPMSEARNIGVKISTGEFIFMIDDDDEANKEFVDYLNAHKFHPKISRFSVNYKGKTEFNVRKINRVTFMDKVQVSTFLLHRSVFDKVRFKDGIKYEDNHFSSDLIRKFGIRTQKKIPISSVTYNFVEESVMGNKHELSDLEKALAHFDENDAFKFKLFINLCKYFSPAQRKMIWKQYFKNFSIFKSKMSPYYFLKFILWKVFGNWSVIS